MVFMLITPVWAMYHQLFLSPELAGRGNPDYLLGGIGLATIALEAWMLIEAFRLFPKAKGVLEPELVEGDAAGFGQRLMVWEIVALVGLAAVFVVLKVLQSEEAGP